jgi:hypothetical protein
MKPERWHIGSLRRFKDRELILYVYLGIGGALSAIYCVGAVYHGRIVELMLHAEVWTNQGMLIKLFGHIILSAIGRVIFWLPQVITQCFMGDIPIMDWLLATNILKALS